MTWVECELGIPGEPVAKERPRFGRGHTYTPKRTKDAESRIAGLYRRDNPDWQPDATSTFHVDIAFDVTGRQDLDNLVKTVLDALNRIVWRDDVQVTMLNASVHRRAASPSTWIHITRIPASEGAPTRVCVRCGTTFLLSSPASKAKLCSRSCRLE